MAQDSLRRLPLDNPLDAPLLVEPRLTLHGAPQVDGSGGLPPPPQPSVGCLGVAVFYFDPREGNVVEWCFPPSLDAESSEFSAIASGMHESPADFVYFRHGRLYGLSCFHKLRTGDAEERDVRMRAVAAFSPELEPLHRHHAALLAHAARLNANPGDTEPLLRLLEPSPAADAYEVCAADAPPLMLRPSATARAWATWAEVPEADGGALLAALGGSRLLTLWKGLLLRRRVLLYAPPPVGELCERALRTLLVLHTDGGDAARWVRPLLPEPLLHVGLHQAHELARRDGSGGRDGGGVVACTGEALFFHKPELWDVFASPTEVRLRNEDERGLWATQRDEMRFARLAEAVRAAVGRAAAGGACAPSNGGGVGAGGGAAAAVARAAAAEAAAEGAVARYFAEQNAKLFDGLEARVAAGAHTLEPADLERCGMGASDAPFMRLLVKELRLNLEVKLPRFRCC